MIAPCYPLKVEIAVYVTINRQNTVNITKIDILGKYSIKAIMIL